MKPLQTIYSLLCCCFLLTCQKPVQNDEKNGTLKITFVNKVKNNPIGLNTAVHSNPSGEIYTISKLKYYVSNVSLQFSGMAPLVEKDSYHLIDESNAASLSFSFTGKASTYQAINFLLGVDSTRNVSGAQTGALDPLNDMFWTWNSGYIMAKMEGTSPASTQVNNKIEYHIGGFSGSNSVLKNFILAMPAGKPLMVKEGKTTEVIIEANFDKWWQGASTVKIATSPVCVSPGALAKQIADNYINLFIVKDVINY